jgi:hypothetical protein
LLTPLEGLAEFALMHQQQVEESRRRFDAEAGSGAVAVVTRTRTQTRSGRV